MRYFGKRKLLHDFIDNSAIIVDLVCAKFASDGNWYRAEIMKVLTPNEMVVRYIDYGNEARVKRQDMSAIHSSLTGYPVFGVVCGLQKVKGNYTKVLNSYTFKNLNMKKVNHFNSATWRRL